ncbi:hypothetical protein [Ruminococcus sp. NK3A76]|uniref:hypothetical protein n=1 Tax=Ruminococcus sp. NK3A76 TaxID=877411 RepID=UPI00048E3D44|nr:hypothetical protein [Ruminococcus sp. NK3A76]
MFRRFKKGVIAGTIFTAMSNMHACTYGPPPDSVAPSSEIKVYDNSQNESSEITTDETTTTTTTTTTAAKKTTTETEFDPNDNLNEDVYGPPEWFDDSSEEEPAETTAAKPKTTTTAKTTKDTDYDPDDNFNECVYGPPEWFDDSSEGK